MVKEEKRYVLTMDMYLYAGSDKSAIKQAKKLVKELDKKGDNLPAILSLDESPFGSLEIREVEIK